MPSASSSSVALELLVPGHAPADHRPHPGGLQQPREALIGDHSSSAARGRARPRARTSAAGAGRGARAGAAGGAAPRRGTARTPISPPGVTAVVAPAQYQAAASGSTPAGGDRPLDREQHQPACPTATHGSGRSPRLNGTHQVANASAASQGVAARRSRPAGAARAGQQPQHTRPSSVEGSRIHSVDGRDQRPGVVQLVEPAERGLGGIEPAVDVADEPVLAAAADDAGDVAVVDRDRADHPPHAEQGRDRGVDRRAVATTAAAAAAPGAASGPPPGAGRTPSPGPAGRARPGRSSTATGWW